MNDFNKFETKNASEPNILHNRQAFDPFSCVVKKLNAFCQKIDDLQELKRHSKQRSYNIVIL